MDDNTQQVDSLDELLDRLGEAEVEQGRVSVESIFDVVGRRSFGPLLLLAGIVTLAPLLGDIPGVPTIIGIFVFIIAAQLMSGKKYFWIPSIILKRSVEKKKLEKAASWMRKPARFVDKLLKPRLEVLTTGPAALVIAPVCMVVAAAMPIMEFVPFSSNLASIAFTAFGLSLIARDGLLALIAFTVTSGIAVMIGMKVF